MVYKTLVNPTNRYSNSRYIVDNVTPGSPYTTVQSAIDAAHNAGGNASIWIRQGTYTENLTLYDGINIEGQEQSLSIVVGHHTPPATGSCRFTRVGLQATGTDSVFSSAVAGSAILSCLRCQFNINNGYIYNLTNWTGELRMRWCTDFSTNNGIIYNTGGSKLTMNHCLVGAGTGQTFTANGNCRIFSIDFGCPSLFNGAGTSTIDGGTKMSGNITTAGTHTLRISLARIATGTAQAITHGSSSTMLLEESVVYSTNATAIGGTGTITMIGVQFPSSSVISGAVTSLIGVTRTAEVWSDNITRQNFSGFYSWAAGGPYFSDTVLGSFTVLVGGTGYIQGRKVTWTGPQTVTGLVAGVTYCIYIDSTGTIGKAVATNPRTSATYINNIVLFKCLRDSTPVTNNQTTSKQNTPYSFPTSTSEYLYDVIGDVIDNYNQGANITLVGTQGIGISGADTLLEQGLSTTIADSGGVGVTWNKYYTTAGGKWALQNSTNTFTGYYNNGGTPAVLPAGTYGIYALYVGKDNLNSSNPIYYAVLNTNTYANLTAAQNAISGLTMAQASNELALLGLAQLGFIIYRQSTGAIVQVTVSKSTLRSTTSTSGTTTASLVNTVTTAFNGMLSAADTNVQAALDTIDNWGAGTTPNHGVVVSRGVGSAPSSTGAGLVGQPLLSGGASADPAYGTLGVGYGGTGTTTLTDHGVVIGRGTASVDVVTPSANVGYVLTSTGATSNPTWQAAPGSSGFTRVVRQVIAAGGIYTPTSGMLYCDIEACAGGAGGAVGTATQAGGGGGGGEYRKGVYSAVTITGYGTITVAIGAGGATNTAGGNTTLSGSISGTFMTAVGGSVGSLALNYGEGGAGGSGGSGGDYGIAGTAGGASWYGGGTFETLYGRGGNSYFGGGAQEYVYSITSSQNAVAYGGGGGGDVKTSGGGSGSSGVVIVTEYCS